MLKLHIVTHRSHDDVTHVCVSHSLWRVAQTDAEAACTEVTCKVLPTKAVTTQLTYISPRAFCCVAQTDAEAASHKALHPALPAAASARAAACLPAVPVRHAL